MGGAALSGEGVRSTSGPRESTFGGFRPWPGTAPTQFWATSKTRILRRSPTWPSRQHCSAI
eukprot:428936-Alexandrium_andersonii.AAC.1